MEVKYQIKYGLGGGMNTFESCEWEDVEWCSTEKEAQEEAYIMACEDYQSYEGLYGLRDIGQIMEEDEVNEEEAIEIYNIERDSWLVYDVREVKEEAK